MNGHVDAQVAPGDQLIARSKEIQALGAFDRNDRSTMLGKLAGKIRCGATRAHNRAMSEFRTDDDRLMGVGIVPLDDPGQALIELEFALADGWVAAMLTRLDWVVRSWSTVGQYLAQLQRTLSEMLREQMAFTPYVFEDVGDLIDGSSDDLCLFSSDYPHVEGATGPIGRFEGSLRGRPDTVRDKFDAENFPRIFPGARAH